MSGARAILWTAGRERRLLDHASVPLRVRLSMPNQIGGRGHPEEIVVLGAHLDSWDLGTGALDNGCNSALVIAVARAMLVVDSGVGRITGFSLSGRSDAEKSLNDVMRPLAVFDADHLSLGGDLGTDSVDFVLEGVPTLVAAQEPANYRQNFHATSDTYDKVDLRQLNQNAAIAAAAIYGIAVREDPLGPRLARDDLEKLLESTGLAREMKLTGLWPGWASGKRGRSP